jgi:hypothetical protein
MEKDGEIAKDGKGKGKEKPKREGSIGVATSEQAEGWDVTRQVSYLFFAFYFLFYFPSSTHPSFSFPSSRCILILLHLHLSSFPKPTLTHPSSA